ncbi:MAG: LysE family translocator [Halarcobacter sp.]
MNTEIFLQGFIPLALAHFLALLSPGADFFILISTSIKQGKLSGLLTAFGIALGNAIYISFALFGMILIQNNSILFFSIKIIGVLYLLYLSYGLIASKKRDLFSNISSDLHKKDIIKSVLKGLFSALLNPKNSLFYFTMFSISSSEHIPFNYQLYYAIWMFSAVLIWDCFIVYLIHSKQNRILIQTYSNKIEKYSGYILLILACIILFESIKF